MLPTRGQPVVAPAAHLATLEPTALGHAREGRAHGLPGGDSQELQQADETPRPDLTATWTNVVTKEGKNEIFGTNPGRKTLRPCCLARLLRGSHFLIQRAHAILIYICRF